MKKQFLLGLSTIASIATPIATVVACSNNTGNTISVNLDNQNAVKDFLKKFQELDYSFNDEVVFLRNNRIVLAGSIRSVEVEEFINILSQNNTLTDENKVVGIDWNNIALNFVGTNGAGTFAGPIVKNVEFKYSVMEFNNNDFVEFPHLPTHLHNGDIVMIEAIGVNGHKIIGQHFHQYSVSGLQQHIPNTIKGKLDALGNPQVFLTPPNNSLAIPGGMSENIWLIFASSHYESIYGSSRGFSAYNNLGYFDFDLRKALDPEIQDYTIHPFNADYLVNAKEEQDIYRIYYTYQKDGVISNEKHVDIKVHETGATIKDIQTMTSKVVSDYGNTNYWFDKSIKYGDGYSGWYNPFSVTQGVGLKTSGIPAQQSQFNRLMDEIEHGSDVSGTNNNWHTDMSHLPTGVTKFDSYINFNEINSMAEYHIALFYLYNDLPFKILRSKLATLNTNIDTFLKTHQTIEANIGLQYDENGTTKYTSGKIKYDIKSGGIIANNDTTALDKISTAWTTRKIATDALSTKWGHMIIDTDIASLHLPSELASLDEKNNNYPLLHSMLSQSVANVNIEVKNVLHVHDTYGSLIMDYVLKDNQNHSINCTGVISKFKNLVV